MSDQFVAEIRIFGFNFPPTGWALCNGQILPISQNTALFSLLGTTYGGNGTTNFALPNLQSVFPTHPGQGPGLSSRSLGEFGGTENVTLASTQMPAHSHTLVGGTTAPRQDAAGNAPGASPARAFNAGPASSTAIATMLDPSGGGQAHDNMDPFLALNFCIALQGIFPPRS